MCQCCVSEIYYAKCELYILPFSSLNGQYAFSTCQSVICCSNIMAPGKKANIGKMKPKAKISSDSKNKIINYFGAVDKKGHVAKKSDLYADLLEKRMRETEAKKMLQMNCVLDEV